MAPPTALSTTSSIASVNSLPLSPSISLNSPLGSPLSNAGNSQAPVAASPSEEDMTEDEVAIMVKNALRKARKAMSDNMTSADARSVDDDDDDSSALPPPSTDKSGNDDVDLAKRIEEEIMGARAFAEKVYYGDGNKSRQATSPLAAVEASSSPKRDNSSTINSAIHDDSPHDEEPAAIRSNSSPAVQQRPPVSPAVKSKQRPETPTDHHHSIDNEKVSHTTRNVHSSPISPTPRVANISKKEQQQQQQQQQQPRQHRQVVFRHPYPLPPPPILPRPDAAIIASNEIRQHSYKFKTVQPDEDLSALILAASSCDSLVRRSNACGALKVLASKENNRPKMCRTTGLLSALIAACTDDAPVDSDALDARTRAVTALLYLSETKDNRLIVCRHENLCEVLLKVVKEDTGEARLRACCALATLAKTPQNRGWMCENVVGLAGVLSDLMVENAVKEEVNVKADKKNANAAEKKIQRNDTMESRDDSTMRGEDMSASYNSEDDLDDHRMLSNTYSGTFSNGTGTFTEDFSEDEEDGSLMSDAEEEEDDDGYSSGGYSDGESVQEEEGVEMQISSLKKLNIENHGDFLARSQLSACATLTHLTKHCANAPLLAQDTKMLENIVFIASIFDNPLHTRCIEIICNLTRFPSNNARLASNPKVVETLLLCGKSKIPEDRLWAIRTIQNLCSDASSKVTLATGPILSMLSTSAMRKDYDEQYAAVGALMNLSTEPGSIVPLTNTKTVVATLVHLAHSPNTPAQVRKIACDSLATIGLWLQTLASAGTVPEEIPFSPLPTHSATGWLRWES